MEAYLLINNPSDLSKIENTRERILATAKILFSQGGVHGTSIREIAKLADVNLAAINYHFKNKENLFYEITRNCYQAMAQEINAIAQQKNWNTEDFSVAILNFMIEHSQGLAVTFKLFLSEHNNTNCFDSNIDQQDMMFGPPGGKSMHQIILNEVGGEVDFESLVWAIQVIFTHLIHKVLMRSSFKQGPQDNHPQKHFFEPKFLERGLRRLVKVVLNELKA